MTARASLIVVILVVVLTAGCARVSRLLQFQRPPEVTPLAATLVQPMVKTTDGLTITTTPTVVTFGSNITTGSTIVVGIASVANNTAYDVDDLVNGNYTQAITVSGSSRTVEIWYRHNATGGFTGIRVATTGGTENFVQIFVYEIGGLTAAAPTTGSIDIVGGGTAHTCASTGLTGSGFALCIASFASDRTPTPGAGWTLDGDATMANHFAQRRVTAIMANQGPYTLNTANDSSGVLALFAEAVAATTTRRFTLLGVGP